MDIFYDVAIFNGQGVNTCRFSLGAVRSLLLNAPSDFELDGDVTVLEIGTFFTVLCHLWPGFHTLNNPGLTLTYERRVQIAAVVCLPVIPGDVPLSKGNQYTYFRDCRHTKSLSDRWKATKAEYLAQNPHMSERGAQPRRIYEIRRQMAHDLGWVHKDSFHLFETPPRTSEEFLPEIPRPVWNMPFMSNPGMELPILQRFTGRRALPASSAPRPSSLAELCRLNRPIGQRLQNDADNFDSTTASSGTEPLANSDLDSNVATAGSG